MRRVLVLGCPGAGKSVLARRLGAATGLPVVHLDRHFWQPGWVQPDEAAWRDRVAGLIDAPCWIMDGNYASTLDLRLARADTVVVVESAVWLCLLRVVRRACGSFGRERGADMAPGCKERFDWPFLAYILRFRRDQWPRTVRALAGFPGPVLTLRGRRDAADFLRAAGGGT